MIAPSDEVVSFTADTATRETTAIVPSRAVVAGTLRPGGLPVSTATITETRGLRAGHVMGEPQEASVQVVVETRSLLAGRVEGQPHAASKQAVAEVRALHTEADGRAPWRTWVVQPFVNSVARRITYGLEVAGPYRGGSLEILDGAATPGSLSSPGLTYAATPLVSSSTPRQNTIQLFGGTATAAQFPSKMSARVVAPLVSSTSRQSNAVQLLGASAPAAQAPAESRTYTVAAHIAVVGSVSSALASPEIEVLAPTAFSPSPETKGGASAPATSPVSPSSSGLTGRVEGVVFGPVLVPVTPVSSIVIGVLSPIMSPPTNNAVTGETHILDGATLPTNSPPVAANDAYSTNEDTALSVGAPGVLGNDTDADGDPLTAVIVAGASHGTLTLNAKGSFTYTPAAGYNGADSFTYKANDGKADSNVATVGINVIAVNHAPVAVNDSYSTNEDTALSVGAPGVLGNDTDADGDPLTAVIVAGPAHGTLTLNANGSFTYTPAANYNGGDSFTYRANDGKAGSNVATASIDVIAVNHAPVAVNDSYSTNEDTALSVGAPGVLGNDTDAERNPLTAALVTGPAHGTLSFNANGSFTYTPASNYNGGDSFTYRANDGKAGSNVATVGINVTNVNDAPVANAGPDQAANRGALVTLAGTGTDVDGDALAYLWVQTAGPPVMLSYPRSASTTFVAPSVDRETLLTFRLTVGDGKTSVSDMMSVRVRNTAPVSYPAPRNIVYWKNNRQQLQRMLDQGPINLGDRTVGAIAEAMSVLSDSSVTDLRNPLRAQLLAAMLNVRNGSNPMATGADIRTTVNDAVAFLAAHPQPVTSRHPDRETAMSLHDRLDAYNNSSG
ncbi:MAG: tandem-95 repeat protein [Chloroflexi bacterium]|nr:tandem-95 repeat protein [Chloroflexota bacterium]